MSGDADISVPAALLGDPARARVLLALADGRAQPASTLAAEALAQIAPVTPVRSLRQGTRAHALRRSRLCYDHLAGRLGVELMRALIGTGAIAGGDGAYHPADAPTDRPSAPGHDVDYRLTDRGAVLLTEFGIDLDTLRQRRRPLIRYCVDWTEQAHHLAGGLGAAVATRLFDLGWIRRTETSRAVRLTGTGRTGLTETFGLSPSSTDRA